MYYDSFFCVKVVKDEENFNQEKTKTLRKKIVRMKKFKGWIVFNGHITATKFTELFEWLQDTAIAKGIDVSLVKHYELIPVIEKGKAILKGKFANEKPDFVIFWDKDVHLARHLENMGLKLYNSARTIEVCDDKALTFQALSNFNIPMPKTITAPLLFPNCDLTNYDFYDEVIQELGFPLIIKESFGSFGRQVYLVENREDFFKKVDELKHKPHIYQEFIESSRGTDIRIQVVGKQVVTAVLRKSESDFRANVTNGGKMYKYEPTEEQINLALKCSEILGADFAGIDLLFGEDGKTYICEVNSNAHFKNIYLCTDVDTTKYIIDYITWDLEKNV